MNSRRVSLSWDLNPAALGYDVYRNGTLIGSMKTPILSGLSSPGRITFTDVWAAPGQRYRYEIAQSVSTASAALESRPARVTVRTPPIYVALDPGHGGADPGASGSY